jgi:hypothetical protein
MAELLYSLLLDKADYYIMSSLNDKLARLLPNSLKHPLTHLQLVLFMDPTSLNHPLFGSLLVALIDQGLPIATNNTAHAQLAIANLPVVTPPTCTQSQARWNYHEVNAQHPNLLTLKLEDAPTNYIQIGPDQFTIGAPTNQILARLSLLLGAKQEQRHEEARNRRAKGVFPHCLWQPGHDLQNVIDEEPNTPIDDSPTDGLPRLSDSQWIAA